MILPHWHFHIPSYVQKNNIRSHIYRSVKKDNDKKSGWIVGKWFIGEFIDNDDWILASDSFMESMSIEKIDEESSAKNPNYITLYQKGGYIGSYGYSRRKFLPMEYRPKKAQKRIIGEILNKFATNKHCVAFISGRFGAGKSYIAHLIASRLSKRSNVMFCDSLNQTNPNEFFQELCHSAIPSESEPLIVLIDEVDVIMEKIVNGVNIHKTYKNEIRNKTSWNRFFDWFNKGLYPHVIIIMTSNKSKELIFEIPGIDPSWLREGRVDLFYEM